MTSIKRFRPGFDDVEGTPAQQLEARLGHVGKGSTKSKPLNVPFFARLCEEKGVPRPTAKEFIFHPVRQWRLDIAWPEQRVAIEVHGAVHQQGRHTRGSGFVEDRIKVNEAQLLGWIVLEVPRSLGSAESWCSLETVDLVARALKRQKVRNGEL